MRISALSLFINRQFKENYNIYGIGMLVLSGFLAFMFLIIHHWRDSFSGAVQHGVFLIGLFISGGLVSSSMFQEFSHTPSSIWLLSIPIKHSEKLISSILISVCFFLIGYLIIFYCIDIAYLLVSGTFQPDAIFNPLEDGFYQFFFWYLICNGIILLGSVVFTRYSLIKTLLAGIIFFIVFNSINTLMLEFLIPDMSVISSSAFDSFQFIHQGENIKVFLPEHADVISSIFVRGMLPVSIWFVVWLKLKEKQV